MNGWGAIALIMGLIIGPYSHAAAQSILPGDPVRGMTIAEPCVRCHGWTRGPDAKGTPILAGQDQPYLVRQLRKMRAAAMKRIVGQGATENKFEFLLADTRSNHVMDSPLRDLNDQQVRDVAAFFSAMPCEKKFYGRVEQAPRLATRCGSCHGRQGVSDVKNVPSLAGQDETYLRRQLQLFRSEGKLIGGGEMLLRHAKIMETQVKVAPAEDIQALARYYARLPCSE